MKPPPLAIRHATLAGSRSVPRPSVCSRRYATQPGLGSSAPGSRRRAVTPFNDDGHVPWTELSAGEKTARAAQQTFNFGVVVVGVVLTVREARLYIRRKGWQLTKIPGRRWLFPLHGSVLPRQQSVLLQPGRRPDQERPSVSRAPRRQQEDYRIWRGDVE